MTLSLISVQFLRVPRITGETLKQKLNLVDIYSFATCADDGGHKFFVAILADYI